MINRKFFILMLAAIVTLTGLVVAQRYQDSYNRRGRRYGYRTIDTRLRPLWPPNKEFKDDVFTFARVKYNSSGIQWGQEQWTVDYPDSDLNLTYRLQELTSLEVNPLPVIVDLADEDIFNYPFVYLIEPGLMQLNDREVEGLRRYIERGGFVMVDDFWGEREWGVFEREMRRVFPNRPIRDVSLDHEIFNIVYQLKEKPMIPSIGHYMRGRRSDRWDATEPHYRAIFDDDDRIVMMICHNTDLGDGWEREGEDNGYFELYSEKYAYPLGINIVTYAMTH